MIFKHDFTLLNAMKQGISTKSGISELGNPELPGFARNPSLCPSKINHRNLNPSLGVATRVQM
jgi:hypothetical protein